MVAKVERLVNLTVALLETRRPLTLAEIRAKVGGYEHASAESGRRMFERDKDDLRRLGVPIETIDMVGHGGGDGEWGYSIDRRAYALPPVDLDADEIAALAIAVQMTGEDALRIGLAKLAVRAPDPRPTGRSLPRAKLDLGAEMLDGLADALLERRVVTFGYRSAAGQPSTRTLEPYGVVHRRGSWYLVGHDRDRNAPRAFRLDRCTTALEVGGEAGAFEVPDDVDVAALTAGPATDGVTVNLAVDPQVGWQVERHGGVTTGERADGWSLVRFEDAAADRLLPWLLGFGAQVEVLAPSELRDDVVRRLEAVADEAYA